MPKGLFIVFEGIDGSGTTTQCQLLANKIENLGHPVLKTREPGGTVLAESIREILLDPNSKGIADLAELLLYAACRAQHVEEKIRPNLLRGAHVVCDRFTGSTWAYQGFGRGLDLALIAQVTTIAAARCEPDLTIYLRVPQEQAAGRRAKRGERPDRMELAGENFQARVARGYENMAAMDLVKAVTVDGTRHQHQVSEEIWKILNERWPQFPKVPEATPETTAKGSK